MKWIESIVSKYHQSKSSRVASFCPGGVQFLGDLGTLACSSQLLNIPANVNCGVYSFKDVSIPPEVKTVKIGFLENKARYINPQLAPLLTDKLQQKITSQTRLTRTNSDDAHYQISGFISEDDITTAAISGQAVATNRFYFRSVTQCQPFRRIALRLSRPPYQLSKST